MTDAATRVCPLCGVESPWYRFKRGKHPLDNPCPYPGIRPEEYPVLWVCPHCGGLFGDPWRQTR